MLLRYYNPELSPEQEEQLSYKALLEEKNQDRLIRKEATKILRAYRNSDGSPICASKVTTIINNHYWEI